jgi:membrane protease YdiL (CAAX protease family)
VLSFAGLIFAAITIAGSVHGLSSLVRVFGIIPFNKRVILYIIPGVLFGALLGLLNNFFFENPLLPSSLTAFAITAPLIGITEELVFRGYVQTKVACMGAWFSIIFASSGHTLYKYLVIKTLPLDLNINFPKLIVFTFAAGMVFGILRHHSRNVIPSALGHALFDIMVYGGAAVAPVWVWG